MSSLKILDFECYECGEQSDRVTRRAPDAEAEHSKCETCGGRLKYINMFMTKRAPTCRVQWEYYDTANQKPFDSKKKMVESLKRQGLELVT